MNVKKLTDVDVKGKRVFIRADLNVPQDDAGNITEDTRIRASIPSIKYCLDNGAAVMVTSHLGRPTEGEVKADDTLMPVAVRLGQLLNKPVRLIQNWVDGGFEVKPGEVVLLENCRCNKGEKKDNEELAQKMAKLCDVYVNDAFGSAHRAHASTAIIAVFFPDKKMFGYLMADEVANINKVLVSARHPFTAVLGGAKVSGKIEIIKHLMDKVDNLIIGGGMMFTFIKAMGGQIGNSLVEEELLDVAKSALYRAKELGVNLMIPVDAVAASEFNNDAERKTIQADQIPAGWMGMDIGPETRKSFAEIIQQSSTILWNGPMGVFEMPNFEAGTKFIAEAIATATQKGAFSLVGGGDSVAAINKYHLADKVSYVSTGGGAMLEYMEGKVLPGVAAIED